MDYLLKSFFIGLCHSEQEIKTPYYLYFPSELKNNIEAINKAKDAGIKVFYAVKANNYAPLVDEVIKNGYGFDVASKEEMAFVISRGASPEKISFSAPSKRIEDVVYASNLGVKYYAFDSEEEIKKIISNVTNPILFGRIAAYSKDAVFNLSSKFGMTEPYFVSLLKKAKRKGCPIQGVTFHIGSQNGDILAWKRAINHCRKIMREAQKIGVHIEYVNLGGGIPAKYTNKIGTIDFYITKILEFTEILKKEFKDTEFFIEPGRVLSASTMALVTRVIDIKPYKKPPIVVVDTGVFNGIIEPIEHFEYPIFTKDSDEKGYFRVVGFSCEGYDVIRQKVLLPKKTKVGDLITFMYSGAYTFVYENFHMVPYPPIKPINSFAEPISMAKKYTYERLNAIARFKQANDLTLQKAPYKVAGVR